MPKTKHYDARGKACHSWFDLKQIIAHKASQDILKGHMLFQVLVHPFIQIRVPKPFVGHVEIIHYGTGDKTERVKELSSRQLEALRCFYVNANARGWTAQNDRYFVTFTREARVTIDATRRWCGGM